MDEHEGAVAMRDVLLRVSGSRQTTPEQRREFKALKEKRERLLAQRQAAANATPSATGNGGGNNANNAGGNGGGGGNGGSGGGNNAGNGNQPRGGFFSRMSPADRATLKLCLVLILCAVVGILALVMAAWIQQWVGTAAVKTYKEFGDVGASRKEKFEDQAPAQISGTARMHAECGRYTVAQKYTIEGSCFYYENTTTNSVNVPVSSVATPRSVKANFEGKGDIVLTVGGSSCTSTLTYHCRDYLVTHVSQVDGKYNMVLQVPPGQGAILTVR